MNTERDAILAHVHGPLRILAGAGAGKTRVLVDKITGLIAGGHAAPGEILALTFTNKAAEEMADRVRAALASHETVKQRHDLDELDVQTFHAFSAGLLREFGMRVGVERDAQVVSRAKTWQMMLAVLDEVTFDVLDLIPTRLGPNFVDLLVNLASGLADHLQDVTVLEHHVRAALDGSPSDRYGETLRKQLEIIPVLRAYEARKRAGNLLDYGDQMALACRLLAENPDVAVSLRNQYPFVLVDEYQDTNVAQRRLLQLLAIDPASGTPGNITVVGDNDQSIYAFRGATVENILHFERDFPGAGSLPLSINHRSGQQILDVAGAVISRIPPERRPPKQLVAAPDAEPAAVEYFVASDARSEAAHVARLIEEAKLWADALSGRYKGYRGWRAFGVLAATNEDLVLVAGELRRRGIPFELVAEPGFYDRPEVVDLLAVLRAVADPSNNLAIARILQGPRYRIGDRDLVWVARTASRAGKGRARDLGLGWEMDHGYRLIDGIEAAGGIANLSAEARERLAAFRTELRSLIRASHRLPLGDFVAHVVGVTGVLVECAASPSAAARQAERSIARLRDLAASFEPLDGRSDLRAFLEYLEFAEGAQEAEGEAVPSDDDTVKLATIHRAKGLEFPCVFLVAMEGDWPWRAHPRNETRAWNVMPHALRGDREFLPSHQGDDEAFRDALAVYEGQEHRRIGYVGLTRAMRRLVLSRAHFYRSVQRPVAPAAFWEEILETGIPRRLFEEAVPETNPLVVAVEEDPFAAAPASSWDWRPFVDDPAFEPERNLTASEASKLRARSAELFVELDSLAALSGDGAVVAAPPAIPREISVSALLDYLRCPRLFYERHVLGLPEPVSWAARRGTIIHRWIEERAWDVSTPLPEVPGVGPETLLPEDIALEPERVPDEGDESGDDATVEALKRNFLASPYGARRPLYAELPFALRVGEFTIRGRIDAIYEGEDGALEIVDFKTGAAASDPRQLQVYAQAVKELFPGRAVRMAFFNVRSGEVEVVDEDAFFRMEDGVNAMADGKFTCPGCAVHRTIRSRSM